MKTINNNNENIFLKDLSLHELEAILVESGERTFRAKQIYDAVYINRKRNFSDMTVLPLELRNNLLKKFVIDSIKPNRVQHSKDGTIKFLFDLHDNNSIESVLIPSIDYDDNNELNRNTLCVSSQVGCGLACTFCATGKLGLKRNLTVGEIVDQVIQAEFISNSKITNIVFMGMGEPLQNLPNVLKAIDILTNENTKVIGRKKITISTSGIANKINELSEISHPVKLAVSLHATTNGIRSKLMPIAEKWDLHLLREAIFDYYNKTKIPVTYEYILFDGVNNGSDDVKRLAKFVRSVPSRVNIIPFHDISFTDLSDFAKTLKPASNIQIEQFVKDLRRLGVNAFVRTSSGADIDAACGQLALSNRIEELNIGN